MRCNILVVFSFGILASFSSCGDKTANTTSTNQSVATQDENSLTTAFTHSKIDPRKIDALESLSPQEIITQIEKDEKVIFLLDSSYDLSSSKKSMDGYSDAYNFYKKLPREESVVSSYYPAYEDFDDESLPSERPFRDKHLFVIYKNDSGIPVKALLVYYYGNYLIETSGQRPTFEYNSKTIAYRSYQKKIMVERSEEYQKAKKKGEDLKNNGTNDQKIAVAGEILRAASQLISQTLEVTVANYGLELEIGLILLERAKKLGMDDNESVRARIFASHMIELNLEMFAKSMTDRAESIEGISELYTNLFEVVDADDLEAFKSAAEKFKAITENYSQFKTRLQELLEKK